VKRSEINAAITAASEFFASQHFVLPPFAHWEHEEWSSFGSGADEFRRRQLGWDVTDFASGRFDAIGLTLFALRNGSASEDNAGQDYAEKIMYVREAQLTPLHFHYKKTEDIINRGGLGTGDLAIEVYNSTDTGELAETPVALFCDGIERHIRAGEVLILHHGESVTMPPRLYHSFRAVNGPCLIGEVSSRNDDAGDNHFYEPLPRFPKVIEDAVPLRLLCTEYPISSRTVCNSSAEDQH
jgi:D-lyxose ketol-isomerase